MILKKSFRKKHLFFQQLGKISAEFSREMVYHISVFDDVVSIFRVIMQSDILSHIDTGYITRFIHWTHHPYYEIYRVQSASGNTFGLNNMFSFVYVIKMII